MEEESWAAGLGWEKLILVTPQHLDIYTLDISTQGGESQLDPPGSGMRQLSCHHGVCGLNNKVEYHHIMNSSGVSYKLWIRYHL